MSITSQHNWEKKNACEGGMGFPGGAGGKELACQSLGRKIPWRRAQKPTPLFLPGESHVQRSLAGYSPWGPKQLDTTETT